MKPPAILWLGVHKTGTTFLQGCLEASRPAIEAQGIDYMPLEDFRNACTRPLLDRPGQAPARPAPHRSGAARQRLVFDENILGLVQDVCTPEGLYPQGAWRADEVADRLGLAAPHLVLGLRSFDGFLPSLYCETLKSTPFRAFRDFLRCPAERVSWLPLVAGLLRAFPASSLTIYTAEALRGHEARLLSHLLGLPETAITLPQEAERPGFSKRAVEAMEAAQAREPIGPGEAKRLAAAHPRGPQAPGFDPWSPAERRALQSRWQADIETLRGWSRVRLIDPACPALVRDRPAP
jgi:hypothetical protein